MYADRPGLMKDATESRTLHMYKPYKSVCGLKETADFAQT